MRDPTVNGEQLAAFGRWLARERELRGMGRDQVTRAVKLAPDVVEALESGQEARMPPRAYAVGYLKAYAAAVGLDANEVVLRFEEASGPPAGPGRPPRTGAPLRTAVAVRAVVAVLLGAAVAAAGVWALLR